MNLTKKKGFTLIEIVIVLAIAALILIIVFLAVSGAQRSRRDEQRRKDAARYLSAAESFAGNHNGAYPADEAEVDAVVTNYLTVSAGTFNDPSTGGAYTTTYSIAAADYNAAGEIAARNNATCTNNTIADQPGSLSRFAVAVFQETGTSYCASNR